MPSQSLGHLVTYLVGSVLRYDVSCIFALYLPQEHSRGRGSHPQDNSQDRGRCRHGPLISTSPPVSCDCNPSSITALGERSPTRHVTVSNRIPHTRSFHDLRVSRTSSRAYSCRAYDHVSDLRYVRISRTVRASLNQRESVGLITC